MTDKNTSMMREVFKWLSKYEQVPIAVNPEYWKALVTDGADIYSRYPCPLTRNLIYGVIDGLEQEYKLNMVRQEEAARAAGQQMRMEGTT